MTDAISQYGRPARSDGLVRGALDKTAKKVDPEAGKTEAAPTPTPPTVAKPGADTLSLSNVAQKAMSEPEFDRNKVESIKQAIKDGQYPLDPRRIAESFMAIERMISD